MKKGRQKRVTTVKKMNSEKCYEHPSTWAFLVAIVFFLISLFIWIVIPGIESLYGFTLTCMIVFIGLSIFGGVKEIIKKTYDFSYMAIGLFGVSLLFLMITGRTTEFVSLILSFIASILVIPFSIIGIVKTIKKDEDSWKIVMDSIMILGSFTLSMFLFVGMVLLRSFASGNFTGW